MIQENQQCENERDAAKDLTPERANLDSSTVSEAELNRVMNSKASVEGDYCGEEDLDYFDRMFRSYRRIGRAADSFGGISEFLEKHDHLFSAAKDALKALRTPDKNKGCEEMGDHLKALRDFSCAFQDLRDMIVENMGERIQKEEKNCIRCGWDNWHAAWSCKSCGWIFPNMEFSFQQIEIKEGPPSEEGVMMTSNMEKILNAAEDYQDGEIPRVEFMKILDWMVKKIESGVQHYRKIERIPERILKSDPVLAEEMKTVFMKIIQHYKEGLLEMRKGLSSLRLWADSRIDIELKEGIELCLKAASKIYLVKQMADSTADSLRRSTKGKRDAYAGSA